MQQTIHVDSGTIRVENDENADPIMIFLIID